LRVDYRSKPVYWVEIYTARELKGKLVQGLTPGVGGFLADVGPSHKDENFMALVTRTADLA
jgi:hypothetical protein